MKSFAKAFRATLSIALVLCMVMSFVTVSADGTAVTVAGNTPSRLEDGYYTVTYTVSNITPAEDADATIMVYSGDSISKETIKYANQADAASGTATFTMEVPAGVYTVVAGGTGATKGEATLTANTAPAFAEDTATASIDDTAATEAGVVVMAAPVAADADGAEGLVYTLTENDNFELVGGNIVTKAAVAAGTYELTLSVSDGIASDSIAITVTVNKTDIVINAFDAVEAKEVDYGTAKENIGLPATVTADEVVFDVTEWTGEYNAEVAGDYTLTATVAAKAGYNIASAAAPTIKVTVKKAQISAFDGIEAKTVDYNTSKDAVIATLPAEVAAGAYKFAVSAWDSADYNATVPGTYTFTATVVENANYAVAGGVAPTVNVTVSAKPVATVTAYSGYETAKTITYGDELELPAQITATLEGYSAETVTVGVTWACVDEHEGALPVGEHKFVGTVAAIEDANYVINVTADAPEIVVTVNKEVVAIDRFEVATIAGDKYTGTAFADLGLAATAKAYVGEEVVAEFEIAWNEAGYDSASTDAQTITGTINVVDTDTIDYTFAEGADAVTATVTLKIQVFSIESVKAIDTLYVSTEADYVDLKENTLPKQVTVVYNTDKEELVDVIWEEDAQVPANCGETTTIKGELANLPAFLDNANAVVAEMDITTIYEDFTYTVNGSDSDSLVVAINDPINVSVAYDSMGLDAEYGYTVNKLGEAAAEPVYGNDADVAVAIEDAAMGTQYEITVYVKCIGTEIKGRTVTVYVAGKLVGGNAYVNTNADKTYSAMRINKNADSFVVTNDFKNYNGAELAAEGFAYKLMSLDETEVIAESADGIFTKDAYADCDGAYRVIVTYNENGEEVHKAGRTIYITDNALWFSDMTINGKSGSGIVVRKDKGIEHSYVLSDLGTEGVVYVGSELVAFNVDPTGTAVLEPVTSANVVTNIALTDADKGARTLYALAKLTEGQSYYDMKVGRTVYVNDAISSVCNVLLNGSTNCAPTVEEGGVLTTKPYWAAGSIIEETAKYTVQFAQYDKETKTWGEYSEAVECAADGTAEIAKSELGWKNKVKYTIYVNGEETPDAEYEKIFYIQ